MNKYVLYGYGESVASNQVRLALSEKNISYEYNLVRLESKGDHLRDDYKKLNPKTLVPTLTVNGNPICESIDIMKYIDNENSTLHIYFDHHINNHNIIHMDSILNMELYLECLL